MKAICVLQNGALIGNLTVGKEYEVSYSDDDEYFLFTGDTGARCASRTIYFEVEKVPEAGELSATGNPNEEYGYSAAHLSLNPFDNDPLIRLASGEFKRRSELMEGQTEQTLLYTSVAKVSAPPLSTIDPDDIHVPSGTNVISVFPEKVYKQKKTRKELKAEIKKLQSELQEQVNNSTHYLNASIRDKEKLTESRKQGDHWLKQVAELEEKLKIKTRGLEYIREYSRNNNIKLIQTIHQTAINFLQ